MSFCAFAQLVTTVIFFSAWDRSRVNWDNSQNSTQKMRTFTLSVETLTQTKGCFPGQNWTVALPLLNTYLIFDYGQKYFWKFAKSLKLTWQLTTFSLDFFDISVRSKTESWKNKPLDQFSNFRNLLS